MSEIQGGIGSVEGLLAAAMASLLDGDDMRPAPATAPSRLLPSPPAWAHLRRSHHCHGFAGEAWQHLVATEEAEQELDALCAATVCAPTTGPRLALFIYTHLADETGAQVFACLLYAAGDREGARFWWQYAAGAGVDKAAYCLVLDHSRRGEHEDAQVWADLLAHSDFVPDSSWRDRPPLPPHTRRALAAALAFVHQEPHEDLGLIPLPAIRVAKAAFAFAQHPHSRQPGDWMLQSPGIPTKAPPPPTPSPQHTAQAPVPAADTREQPSRRHTAHRPKLLSRRDTPVSSADSTSIRRARRALEVVRVLEKHRLGTSVRQLSAKTGIGEAELGPLLDMLCEEDFAERLAGTTDVYAPGLALDRLALPGGAGIGAQLQRTLAIARDHIGAAVYLSRYSDGDILITQASTSTGAPPVLEHTPFHLAAHASALGKCLLGQLGHDQQAEHITRYDMESFTARTCKDPRAFLRHLDRTRPGEPVYDIREYDELVVCSAVAASITGQVGGLALSMPSRNSHRLKEATKTLQRKAVPILLVLLLTGAFPSNVTPTEDIQIPDFLPTATDQALSERALNHLSRMFATPLTSSTAIQQVASTHPAPHLVADPESHTLYLFEATPPHTPAVLALPHPLTAHSPFARTPASSFRTPGDLLVYTA
ncbi:hypothetical protein KPP03845_200158 (plasmid) [Streptomyces xanthophaeus]|uniref:IclR family transcriptional regulator domain-containing protein n=1 Tax=Streptomyces xanthophaeus TaxID=67385 RepID=UPI00233E92C0|nr:IclR family transcriptional regulator C-terminal domain-containing protein [Streptomyces xanthophaeus]WCD91197.1 hypothetical protein KPP03845_200158 [Streptomyces xanthophaeus]